MTMTEKQWYEFKRKKYEAIVNMMKEGKKNV